MYVLSPRTVYELPRALFGVIYVAQFGKKTKFPLTSISTIRVFGLYIIFYIYEIHGDR